MAECEQFLQKPARETGHPPADYLKPDGLQILQADFDGRNRKVIQRAILEGCFIGGKHMGASLDRREVHGPACKPGTPEFRKHPPPDQQRADTSRISEHFIKRYTHKIGLDRG